ncbi:macro domain-containing protein [Phyllobacterium chamaecytisi]|uniref:macro domain-containing protein n=1 Tax=Phyllobacterium chamaecytisi TaxID=2876082 RepID=UPI001CCF68EC|nr:macro domain-containing protein [Phyllobacterium sp. KW56]MBZ9602614.1 macro domain-containing protein [Phyllobacterium sp. KW56]
MLVYRRTDLFSSPAQTLVNTVNCVGVMGKGIAKEFKEREPEMFAAYKRICDQKLLSPGKLWLWRGPNHLTLNFPTKIHWKNPSKLDWIEAGLRKFVATYERAGIKEISFPRLGCGNGGLDWHDVQPLMEKYLTRLPIDVYVHDYTKVIGLPEHLEHVADQLKHKTARDLSFDVFVADLLHAVDLSGDGLVDITTEEPIHARVVDDNLQIDTGEATWTFERDDLRGVWLSLLKGLLTREKAGWLNEASGSPLLSLVSLLPQVRPIEIRRQEEDEPELAVELAPTSRGSTVVPPVEKQIESVWH